MKRTDVVGIGFMATRKRDGRHHTNKNFSPVFDSERGIKSSLSYYGIPHENYDIYPIVIIKKVKAEELGL